MGDALDYRQYSYFTTENFTFSFYRFLHELMREGRTKLNDVDLPTSLGSNPVALYLIWDTVMREWKNKTIT